MAKLAFSKLFFYLRSQNKRNHGKNHHQGNPKTKGNLSKRTCTEDECYTFCNISVIGKPQSIHSAT